MSPESRVVARQCQLCEAHCGVLVHVEKDGNGDGATERVTKIEGDPTDVLSQGYICPKATALADLHRDPDRVRMPLKRVGDGFEEISWSEAFSFAGERLRAIRSRHGKDAIGVYQGNPSAHSTAAIGLEIFKAVLRSRNIYSASSVDQFPQHLVAMDMFGDLTLMPVADVDRTDFMLIIGANPVVSNGSITTMPNAKGRLRAIKARGGRVVVVDPRRTETVRVAKEHVSVRPGGDPYLLLGMLNVIYAEGLAHGDRMFDGDDQISDLVAGWTPERVAAAAGVEAGTIAALARDFAGAPSAVAYGRIGVCHHTTGSLTHWLINVLNAVTGNLDSPGGAMFTTPPVDLGRLLRIIRGGKGERDTYRSRVSDLPSFHGELPSAALPEEIMTPGDRQIRALITVAGNPALSHPEAARIDEALESVELLISIDMYVTETTRHADLILPPISHLEREEMDLVFPYFSVRNNARFSRRVFQPPRGAMEDFDILLRLAAELPTGVAGLPIRAALKEATRLLTPGRLTAALVATGPQGVISRGLDGLTAGKVKDSEGGVDLGPLEPRLKSLLQTDDRKVHLAPPALLREAQRVLVDSGPRGGADGYDLQLIGRRHLRTNNSWLHNVETMVKGRDRCTLLMHPEDAAERGLSDGDEVEVTSRVGTLAVPLEVSAEMRRTVVSLPHGWGHDVKGVGWSTAQAHGGANVNILTDASLVDGLSGNAAVNATWVRVQRAAVPVGV